MKIEDVTEHDDWSCLYWRFTEDGLQLYGDLPSDKEGRELVASAINEVVEEDKVATDGALN